MNRKPPKGWDPNHPHGCWMDDRKKVSVDYADDFKSFASFDDAMDWVADKGANVVRFDADHGDWTATVMGDGSYGS